MNGASSYFIFCSMSKRMDAIGKLAAHDQSPDASSPSDYLSGLPFGLVEAQLIEVEQDAWRVGTFLNAYMDAILENAPENLKRADWRGVFSAKVLLELAAALRILDWEKAGLVRQDMELPNGDEAIRQVLLNAASDELQPDLSLRLVKIFAENFAWHAMRDLGAHVLLGRLSVDEDRLADCLAQLLLQNSHLAMDNHG